MLLEKVLFPAPNPPNYTLKSHANHLFWLPRSDDPNQTQAIPCMIYSPMRDAKFFIIWCHGNGCDIGSMHTILKAFSRLLNAHVLNFEYPSYGLCQEKTTASEKSINEHAERAYSFVRDILRWPINRIIIYGHSIGSGPACHIASIRPIGGLILQSPYTSIRNLVREKIGILSLFIGTSLWDNLAAIEHITIPVLFIHGQLDDLISPQHSQILYDSLSRNEKKELIFLPHDDHNSMSMEDVISLAKSFLNRYFPMTIQSMPRIHIDSILFRPPSIIQHQSTNFLTSAFRASAASVNATKSVMSSLFPSL
ncbi:unnamed protein product [Rotaria sordida]|uniref:Serine aminopeptidase S33 domain-containing protein n=1 Tax=Rotaria sordida TaxID=392033 RepID=A0A813YGE4_9BILA|nr:unnamed protein product [Rotaria sordida]CAF3916772.1 unnamed protein product [Rotaria sordida]